VQQVIQAPRSQPTARDILGLNKPRVRNFDRSLEIEVDLYLNDPETGTSSLMYWQVNSFLFNAELLATDSTQ
jgi:hypothetical protein